MSGQKSRIGKKYTHIANFKDRDFYEKGQTRTNALPQIQTLEDVFFRNNVEYINNKNVRIGEIKNVTPETANKIIRAIPLIPGCRNLSLDTELLMMMNVPLLEHKIAQAQEETREKYCAQKPKIK